MSRCIKGMSADKALKVRNRHRFLLLFQLLLMLCIIHSTSASSDIHSRDSRKRSGKRGRRLKKKANSVPYDPKNAPPVPDYITSDQAESYRLAEEVLNGNFEDDPKYLEELEPWEGFKEQLAKVLTPTLTLTLSHHHYSFLLLYSFTSFSTSFFTSFSSSLHLTSLDFT
jgi:hypothetical protein